MMSCYDNLNYFNGFNDFNDLNDLTNERTDSMTP
jgi:hypothetical protein